MDDKELHNLLFSAIHHNNVSLLNDLLDGETGRNLLDLPGDNGNVLLHSAVLERNIDCVRCLVEHGANPNIFDTVQARTPLHLAVELNQIDIVKAFLDLDHINLDIRDDRNLTCSEIALFCDNSTLADLIEKRQNDMKQHKDDFYSIMNQACSNNEPNTARDILKRYEKRILDRLPINWTSNSDRKVLVKSSLRELINWSSSSWNDVTLLFKSASKGHTEICRLLIEYGATAKCNENTNYSPLYVAAYGGFTETVKLLLDSFPSLVHEVTIEKWTVLHACCLQGHSDTAKLILTYPYADYLKCRYVSRSNLYEYYFAFDLNAQDAAGQTVIYLTVSANNEKLLDTLLQFNVESKLLDPKNQPNSVGNQKDNRQKGQVKNTSAASDGYARIVNEPQHDAEKFGSINSNSRVEKLIRQLKKLDSSDQTYSNDKGDSDGPKSESKYLICPFEMDSYCDYNSKTALHLAVCQQYHSIATTLLVNGSNPNLPILTRDTVRNEFSSQTSAASLNWLKSSKSTCLKEACKLNDELMCEILIRYGASDNPDNLALKVAATNKNNLLISKFLSLKSNVDPEYKINKKCNVEFASRYKQSQKLSKSIFGNVTTTFSSMFPASPVMIDWQNLKCIRKIEPQWLIDASLIHNKRLNHQTTSLIAITRLDLSSNNLKSIHPVIFRLPSLRELNLSNNRLESLNDWNQRGSIEGDSNISTTKLIESHRTAMKRSKSSNLSSINLESSNIIDLNEPQEWDLPYLETLDLHDNRLIALPDCLFELPKLTELDVSSNQIRQLPWSMWTAPSLREVIASGNLLDDLPRLPQLRKDSASPNFRINSNMSPSEEKSSLTSNQSTSVDRAEYSFLSSAGSDSAKDQSYANFIDSLDTSNVELNCSTFQITHINHWKRRIDLVNNLTSKSTMNDNRDSNESTQGGSRITYLNLSYNSFAIIPPVLACVATDLTRLNISHNRLTSLGPINYYPANIKSLDLSSNQITNWFSYDSNSFSYCHSENTRRDSVISFLYENNGHSCQHKIHLRLDNLKSINLSHNMLKDIRLTLNSSPDSTLTKATSSNQYSSQSFRDQLAFPNITALDVSFNKLQQIPKFVSELKDLSVFNIGGNVSISSLPAELGLNTKLWNLGINGCCLNEPLKSIVDSKTYKTIDIIGYLRSILEEAKPYARMKLMLVGQQGIGKTSLLEQMRLEGSSNSRGRASEHWTKRMGHTTKSNIRNQKGVTLSTVGVDIHDWVFCKRVARNQHSFGAVSFSTWDFGGQQEFYATHRYFLSKRSMYLVVWRLTDGIAGINGIQQWLVNIQSRASGSPVIIVGTHEDMIEGGETGEKVKNLQEEVHKRFINISDHDKCGLPRVVDFIVVSTKTKLNIRNLCNRIYDVVFSLKCPGSSERLLEQKIPATYLYLEEIISWIAHDKHQKKREPVLNYEEYRKLTSEQLKSKYNKVFRDLESNDSREINYNSELQQATRFLHENGVLLHYEDANLRDLYFLDPQWLCDILSHVVTIREINPHVKNGLMKISDLCFLFKSNNINFSGGIQSYVVNLLNKFEVALTWNSQYLLIPSLLPTEPNDAINDSLDFPVKMAPKMRGRSAVRKHEHSKTNPRATSVDPTKDLPSSLKSGSDIKRIYSINLQPTKNIHRLVLLRYLPAGFLARLQSGILSDPAFEDICVELHRIMVEEACDDKILKDCLGNQSGWTCWKSGIKLSLQSNSSINSKNKLNISLLTIQEMSSDSKDTPFSSVKFRVESNTASLVCNNSSTDQKSIHNSNKWCDFHMNQYSNIVVVSVPNWTLQIEEKDVATRFVKPDRQCISKLLSNAVDHIDNLLEDWYPSLGTRFAHTLGGNYLVTRIVPCYHCFPNLNNKSNSTGVINHRTSRFDARASRSVNRIVNFSLNSASVTGEMYSNQLKLNPFNEVSSNEVFCYYVEQCILNAYDIISDQNNETINNLKYSLNLNQNNRKLKRSFARHLYCPKHGSIPLSEVAPDIIFDDIQDYFKIENEQIERCKLIGRGTFGFVFKGSLRSFKQDQQQVGQRNQEVALKLLQPVDPGSEAEQLDMVAYNAAKSNWLREPFHHACKSYCTARHEVNILQTLNHPNIVQFIGLCVKPLAIVLELAPLGCLSDIFKTYKKAGLRIDQFSIRKTILQVAKALEYLHQQRVIYRDLKAENVLVWSFPSPFATQLQDASVELKLADYGISRQALCTGVWKGFAGTINFLAPEIVRHNGDEEYTEKVDCFSFGMFMYELLTLRPPFKHNEGIKSHLADNRRPALAMRDLVYPNYMIDLMSVCWSQEPQHRPTASQIVSIANTPEFMQLLDVVAIEAQSKVRFCEAIQYTESNSCSVDLWLGRCIPQLETLITDQNHWAQYQHLHSANHKSPLNITSMCVVENTIWLCDIDLTIYVLSLGTRLKLQKDPNQSFLSKETQLKTQDEVLNQAVTFSLDMNCGDASIIKLNYIASTRSILMLLSSGQLWTCELESMQCQQLDDNSIQFRCIAVQEQDKVKTLNKDDELKTSARSFNIYCGQSNGISLLEVLDNSIHRHSILPFIDESMDNVSGEYLVDSNQPTEVSFIVASIDLLWTAAGCTIHLWNIKDKRIVRKLDCWKLVPCSESLESINIESYYDQARTSVVSSLVYLNNQLFVGTSHGCFMVVEADLLKPMIVFRPYESDIKIITPVIIKESSDHENINYLVTVGSGYRDLMKRYVNSLENCETKANDVAILWSADYYNF